MAEAKTKPAASRSRAKAETAPKRAASEDVRADLAIAQVDAADAQPVVIVDGVTTSPLQREIMDATEGTSEIESGGTETVKEDEIRMESEGVKTPIKTDFDNPESPVLADPAGTLVGPSEPGKVKIGPGETAAQHEAHVQMNSPKNIAERLEREQGEEGLSTDLIAREQHERAARVEYQRVEPGNDELATRNPNK